MHNIVEIKDLNFGYNDKNLYTNFSLNIKEGSFTTIVGKSGSGKSTLAKIMYGLINSKSYIKIDNMFINPKNLKEIRKKIGFVVENPDSQFVCSTVKEDMNLALKNYGYSIGKIEERINAVAKLLSINTLLDLEPHLLSGGEKQLISLAIALSHEPKLLIIDEGISMIDSVTREKILKILKTINKSGVTIINISSNSEDILKGGDVIIIGDGKVVLHDSIKNAFLTPRKFTQNQIDLPFVVDLSIKLKYYNVIDDIYFDSKKLVDALWK